MGLSCLYVDDQQLQVAEGAAARAVVERLLKAVPAGQPENAFWLVIDDVARPTQPDGTILSSAELRQAARRRRLDAAALGANGASRVAVEDRVAAELPDDLRWLEATFGFHPLAIEACYMPNARPKLEEYDHYLFLVVHALGLSKKRRVHAHDIQIFLSENFLVTVITGPVEALKETLLSVRYHRPRDGHFHPDLVLYRILDRVTTGYYDILDQLDDRIDSLEERVLRQPDRAVQRDITDLKRQLVTLRRAVSPLREIVNQVLSHEYPYVRPEAHPYLRDILNAVVGIYDLLDTQRDMLSSVLDIYLSAISNNLNEVMRRLTVISTIFLPGTLVTGFFGMNLAQLPYDQWWFLWLMVAFLVGMPLAMIAWFRLRRWT